MFSQFKFYFRVLVILLFCLKGFSQDLLIDIKTNSDLKFFSLGNQIHFSINDSIYRRQGNTFEYATTSRIGDINFKQIQDSLFSKRGGGYYI